MFFYARPQFFFVLLWSQKIAGEHIKDKWILHLGVLFLWGLVDFKGVIRCLWPQESLMLLYLPSFSKLHEKLQRWTQQHDLRVLWGWQIGVWGIYPGFDLCLWLRIIYGSFLSLPQMTRDLQDSGYDLTLKCLLAIYYRSICSDQGAFALPFAVRIYG